MKNLIRKALAIATFALLLCASAHAQTRIGTVDLQKVWDNYWRQKQGDAAIKSQAADKDKEFKEKLEEYNKSKDEYQKLLDAANDQAVSASERDKRKIAADAKLKALKDTQDALAAYSRQIRAGLEEQSQRMRESLLGEIYAVVKAKGQAGNYNLVFDSSAQTINKTPILLYVSKSADDLTDAVLQQLNATAPASGTGNANDGKVGQKKR